MPLDPSLTSTRITPDQIEPAVGEEYRHRMTGNTVTLTFANPCANLARIYDGKAAMMLSLSEFYEHFIHAKARQ